MKQLQAVQALRFFAALFVAFYHVQLPAAHSQVGDSLFSLFRNGSISVDIFFVLSGFTIYSITAGRRFAPADFLVNRFWRIVPPYWCVLGAAITIAVVQNAAIGGSATYDTLSPGALVVSTLLLPLSPQIYPVAWTLTLEISFNVIFCLAFWFGGLRAVIASVLLWYAAAKIYSVFIYDGAGMVWLFHSVVLEFLYGIVIGILYRRGPLPLAPLVGLLGIAWMVVTLLMDQSPLAREFWRGLPAAMIVYGAAGVRWRMPAPLLLAGESAYLIYLLHPLVFSLTAGAAAIAGRNLYDSDLAMALMVLATVVLSMAGTVLIERPYISWYKARLRRGRERRAERAPSNA